MPLHNRPSLKERRRALRNRPTEAEHLLWYQLRGSQLDGRKFRRQHSIGPFIVDFFCPEERLAIELDGDYHHEPDQKEYDRRRTEFLERQGIKVLRFESGLALTDQQCILDEIRKVWTTPHPGAPFVHGDRHPASLPRTTPQPPPNSLRE